jgi:hypothetical protein
MKEPPQMRYFPDRFLLTAELSGEFRVTIMESSSGLAVGTKPVSSRCGQLADSTRDRLREFFRVLIGMQGYALRAREPVLLNSDTRYRHEGAGP